MEIMQMKTLRLRSVIVFISLITISLAFVVQTNAKVDPKLAAGTWVFNEGKGDVTKDITGNGNDGILKTSPKWIDGKSGKGLDFDGKGACVEVPKSDSLDLSDKVTIVAWVYPYFYGQSGVKDINAADGKSANILSKMESAGSYIGPYWWEYRNNGQVNAYFAAAAPAGTYLTPTIPKLVVDKWSHIAATYDSATGTANVYLDGVLVQSPTTKGFGALKAGVELVIGSGKGGADYGKPFNGKLDEIAVFHSALALSDIVSIMNDGLERALGLTAVSPSGRLATTWGNIKGSGSSF
jgi:hypothetical protein